ncbi:SNF2 domain-containing protein CLASSY 1-like [Chenopodium quinoa]|uniref:SNF2 domain-containing protein CLASSY 1-like n=1 Tax=Chenopodium quinoa TaxID=63459 RepID=UPI000B77DFBA|nr:SNF2 domain-containing protein CLASSY 1-like [Chenopodium quinoa]XP_021769252.1 SNF2 domain-containing protein CLASSY 1-like [Chenopodium quinoa]
MRKRSLHLALHPFDDHPFEIFYQGMWKSVDRLRISSGTITFSFLDLGYLFEEKSFLSTLRLRPRRATLTDCTCVLRPGADVSVFSTPDDAEESSEGSPAGWFDARITSVERKPHESECNCKFYIKFFYISDDNAGTDRKKLSKEIETVGINQISVLQVLEQRPSENTHYRWNLAEDCTSLSRTKLFLSKFASDISWLLVTSVQNQTVFDVRAIEKKIVYQILDTNFSPYSTSVRLSSVSFRTDGDITFSAVFSFVPMDNEQVQPVPEVKEEEDPLSGYELTELRRSKRRNVQPERYLGEIGLEVTDTTALRIGYKFWNQEDLAIVLVNNDEDTSHSVLEDPQQNLQHAIELYSGDRIGVETIDENLAKDGLSDEDSQNQKRQKRKYVRKEKENKKKNAEKAGTDNQLAIVPLPGDSNQMPREQSNLLNEIRPNPLDIDDDNVPLKFYKRRFRERTTSTSMSGRMKKISELDDYDHEPGRGRRNFSHKQNQKFKHRAFASSRSDKHSEDPSRNKKKPLDISAYKDLISTYMKNIQLTIENKQPISTDAWKNLQGASSMYEKKAADEARPPEEVEEEEESETEMLFREMDLCLASAYFEEEHSKAEDGDEPAEKFFKNDGSCQHVFTIDDEIGILCRLCGYVITEIRDVTPPFMRQSGFTAKHDRNDNKTEKDDTEHKLLDEACADLVYNPASYETLVSESNDNVWGLIPSIKKKLHDHQKKAFEFLWRNLAGSLIPSEMEPSSKKVGGCVISHAPGAGKTFLIIAFLVSYLKLFPGKRPLVLAPKTTLYTWYKEIIKWEFPVPVYQIHGRRTYRDRIYMQKVGTASSSLVPNGDIMHVLDCLEKIQKWHAHPSVLLMGYTSFLSLMREDSKYAHRRYMGQILRESPGILILDEGHNPRSTKSRLRKALMRVDTEFRILLSGTLFQNNFGEYFNTLCLARPKFVDEVLRVLDPKYKKKIKGQNKTRTSIENRARKVFMDIIARKINSSETEERADGLNMLKNMTNKFIDVYEGGGSENLPGLQSYTLMMKPTPLQHEILVRLHKHMNVARGFPLELELMITLGSIHPWLIKSAVCANKFLSLEELQSLDEFRLDPTKGSKVKFVLGLVQRSIIRREKVLIFCHNIAPINLFLELFERIYGWKKGHEVLVLQGDLELFERGRVMDKFEERGGPSKVLLASINACAEGITLTAASRVVLLDSEWNPSKQKQAIARAFRPGQEKIVYVYQLLVNGTLEEDKHGRTTWKEWVSCMIFSEEHVDDPSKWQAEKIEDALLREIVEEDHAKSFHMIMKNERASYENPLKVITEE